MGLSDVAFFCEKGSTSRQFTEFNGALIHIERAFC